MKAIRIQTHGSADVLRWEEIPAPSPARGEVLIRLRACGVNFIDIYFREGLYPVELPVTLGLEGAGVVERVGDNVNGIRPGDRVAYVGPMGSYAEMAVVPAGRVVPIPDEVTFGQAAAAMVQGITAHYLSHSTFALNPGCTCLVHAAAGGVGLLLCQMAKIKGARVIGTVSTLKKAELAKKAGADEVIVYTEADPVAAVRAITDGKGVDVVYDGVGKSTFSQSLDCLRPRGLCVLFGQASGKVPPVDLTELNRKGSLYVTRPGINAYIATREELIGRMKDIWAYMAAGRLKIVVHHEYPLAEARRAHEDLEGRRTTGKIILVP